MFNSHRTAISLFALSAAMAVSVPALAQTAPATDDQTTEDIIVTAQQAQKQVVSDGNVGILGNKSALETPFNLTSYTAQLVLDQQSETIGAVLANEPSVRTTFGSGNQSEQFVIRGFAVFGDDVSIDGLYGVTPRQLVSPELYGSIQVLNGANAFLFGAAPGGSGIGGSINLIPKRADKTLLRATASWSQQSIFGGNVDVGTRLGDDEAFGIRLNGVYRKGEAAIDREHRDVTAASADLDFHRGNGRFFLDFGVESQQAYAARPIVNLAATAAVPATPAADFNYAQPWSYTKLRDLYAVAKAEVDVAPGMMVYTSFGFRDGMEKGDYSTVTITNGATGAATQSRLYVPREDNNEAGQIGFRGKVSTGGISNEFNLGASAAYTENRNAFAFGAFPGSQRTSCGLTTVAANAVGTNFCTNLYAPILVPKPADSTTVTTGGSLTDLPRVSKGAFTSLFASDTLGAFDDHFLLTVGVRQQKIVVDGFDRTTLRRTTHYDESRVTPVVGLVVRPTSTISFYANRIEGLAQGPTAPATALNSGEIFPPFKSVQYEAGGKIAVRGLTGTVALYQIKQPSGLSVPVTGGTQFIIAGEQRNRGMEISLNGEPTPWLRIIGGATFNDAILTHTAGGTNDGHKAVGVPNFQTNLGVEIVPAFLKNATFTGRVVHTSSQWVDITNTRDIPGWTTFNLGVRYVVVASNHPITLRLSADNVTNKSYWYSSFGGYLVQGTPRTIKSSITFEY